MLFTNGKTRFYEKMMQEVPNFHKDKIPDRSDSRFKYKYSGIDCVYCNERKGCGHKLCPHIMENLSELITDDDFIHAVETAESCQTAQKNTLLTLKKQMQSDTV